MSYVGKWVVALRYPNAQNSYIGKIQCLYILKETANMVYGVEDKEHPHWRHHYNKDEVVRIITEEEVSEILIAQTKTRINYKEDSWMLQAGYAVAIKQIAEGKRKISFKFMGE